MTTPDTPGSCARIDSPRAYHPKRGIIIMVDTEADQRATYEQLRALGFDRLRVVTA